jgi:FtsP/CotA-like multicopper oxidase with cupredoxin domain
MTYVNELPSFNKDFPYGPGLVQGLVSVDKTIHWANPLNSNCMDNPLGDCGLPFTGSPPATVHLHGGEVAPGSDGGPDSWFTPDGKTGPGYRTLFNAGPGKAVYLYPNFQEPGTLFFHDHALGATRTNLYSGLAAFYFIRGPLTEPRNLPKGAYEIEMAIQDRQFDTNGQLVFPDGSGNPDSNLNGTPPNPGIHPFWIPEFFGDVAIVNGAPWPVLNVEPRRYLFRIVDGSNARFYNLSFGSAPVFAIGADDNYLDAPVPVSTVFIAPGERAYVIVDFTNLKGQTITVTNDAPAPYPDGGLIPGGPGQIGIGSIMQFVVNVTLKSTTDTSCNPVNDCRRPLPMVRLTNGNGNVASGVTINKVRQLTLKEHPIEGFGPVEVFVNNTRYDGKTSPSIAAIFSDGVSELPQVGSTELWEIINLTIDAHPMHTHLTQFQVLNRQQFLQNPDDPTVGYPGAWAAAFGDPASAPLPDGCTAGVFCPGYGPPLAYNVLNADGALGGNPAISTYLTGTPTNPAPEESGWKDTAKAPPGQVTRLLVRWAPTSTPKQWVSPGRNLYPFDPTKSPGYVWHCHIVDHEDNEMMRPYNVTK